MKIAKGYLLACLIICIGCTSPTYHWGSFNDVVYHGFLEPEKATPEKQIDVLTKQIELSRHKELLVPPGLHAHLGVLFFEVGNSDLAQDHLLREKELFPESSKFIDGMLTRMKGGMQK